MVVREACVANTRVVCLAVGAAMLATACATSHATYVHTRQEPLRASNIRVAFPLEPCVGTMLSRSATFRRTYLTIANRRGVSVRISLEPTRKLQVRAETDVHSFVGGRRVAEIRLHTTDDVVELIAHEMEHVREQIEGTNLMLLSIARNSEVRRIGTRFETRRGIETGLQVAEEVGSSAARMCKASLQNAALMRVPF
jgi:hypothetical protein